MTTTYTESKAIDLIQILEHGNIQVRWVKRVYADGIEIAKSFERSAFDPGTDLSLMPVSVAAIAKVVWTDSLMKDWAALQADSSASFAPAVFQPVT